MTKHILHLSAAAALILAIAHHAHAQTPQPEAHSTLIAPLPGDSYAADSSGHVTVGVTSSPGVYGHGIIFKGPMVGTVTWGLGINAFLGTPPTPRGSTAPLAVPFGKPSTSGSQTVNLSAMDSVEKPANCYGTADYSSSSRHGSKAAYATATVSYSAPGVPNGTISTPVTFTVVYP